MSSRGGKKKHFGLKYANGERIGNLFIIKTLQKEKEKTVRKRLLQRRCRLATALAQQGCNDAKVALWRCYSNATTLLQQLEAKGKAVLCQR